MSNDLILSVKNALAQLDLGVDDDTRAVAGGAGSNKRISIEGGVFRKYAGGKEVGRVNERHMNVVFVKMAHAPSRTYYSQAYQKGVKVSPTCWSNDSKTPDPEVKTPQAASCDQCPFSVDGSGQGGRGKACRLQWRTAVVLPHDPSGDVMQLVLPAASVWGKEVAGARPFKPYIQYLANNNISAGRVVTKMEFDTDSSAPKLMFSLAGAVELTDIEAIKAQGKTQAAENAVKLTVFQTDSEGGDADVAPPEFSAAAPEPVLREKASEAAKTGDYADVVKKWTKGK